MLLSKLRLIVTTIFALILSISLLSCNGAKSTSNTKDTTIVVLPGTGVLTASERASIERYAKEWYDSSLAGKGFNGGMIVAKKGNIVFEVYKGTGHINQKDTITDSTSFHIASVSKTFTAMAVLKLWQDGKLNIDDELSKYFPGFNYPGVTVRSLLNHRSGLPNYVYFMELQGWDKKRLVKNEDVLNYLISRKSTLANIGAPNVHFTYCNTNYALLALLIEKVSGEPYAVFMKNTFFQPLQMTHTFVGDSSMVARLLPSYDWRGGLIPYTYLDQVYGDKNIYSTPRDLLTWDRALTSGTLFTAKTLEEAYMPYSNEKPGIRNYGLGWRMNIYPNGKKMIYHNGWWHGNNAAFIRLLQDSATIIVVGNKFNRNIYHARELARIFGAYDASGEEEGETDNNAAKSNVDTSSIVQLKKIPVKKAPQKIIPKRIKPVKLPAIKKTTVPKKITVTKKRQAAPPKNK